MSYKDVFDFEDALSQYTGAPYVVVTDGCTHAIELCLRYDRVQHCSFSAFTYLSVPMTMSMLNIDYTMTDEIWLGEYQFHNTRIWDSARRLERNMYRPGQMQCLSFGNTKPLQLGRVGAVLLDDVDAYHAISCMRSDGRDLRIMPWTHQREFRQGYHYFPTLESCRQGLNLLPTINESPKFVQYNDCRSLNIKT